MAIRSRDCAPDHSDAYCLSTCIPERIDPSRYYIARYGKIRVDKGSNDKEA